MIFNEKYNNTIRFALGASSEFYNTYTTFIINLPEEIIDHTKALQSIRYEVDDVLYEIYEFRNTNTKKKEIKLIENDYKHKAGVLLHVASIDEELLTNIKEKTIASIALESEGKSISCELILKKESDNTYTLTNKTFINKNIETEPTITTYTLEQLKKELKISTK